MFSSHGVFGAEAEHSSEVEPWSKMGIIEGPYQRATRLQRRSFDHGSVVCILRRTARLTVLANVTVSAVPRSAMVAAQSTVTLRPQRRLDPEPWEDPNSGSTLGLYNVHHRSVRVGDLYTRLYYTICYILYTIHYILYTIYYTLYYILYTIHYKLYTIYYILYTLYSILYTLWSMLYTLYSILYTLYSILYTVYCIPYYTILYYTILYYTILYYTKLYYNIL